MAVLLLSVPTQDAFDNPLVERNPRKIAKWLDQLPLLNPAETVTPLLDALQALSRQPLDDRERLKLLGLYQPAVSAVFHGFTQRALRQVPLPAAQRERIKQDMTRLCLELANGYKWLVLHAHQEGIGPVQEPLLLLAAYHAMEQLVHGLLHSFRIHGPVPPRVYLEIHQLYAWAEDGGACDQPIALGSEKVTLGALYRRILLLCCADPARLNEDEVLRLYALLARYADHSLIVSGSCTPPHEGRFGFDLYSDAPPRPCARLDIQVRFTQSRVFDASAVPTAVRNQAETESQGEADEERRLLRMLLPQLESTPQRAAPRQDVQQTVLLIAGIPALHYYLSDARRLKHGIAQLASGIAVQVIEEASENTDYSLDVWQVGNASDTGYMLHRASTPHALRVGELIGVVPEESSGAQAAVELAVVRWMRHGKEGGMDIGVERIVGAAAPVRCQLAVGAVTDAPPRDCLFLPSNSRQSIPATLIAPKRFYARGQRLQVDVGAKTLLVEAGHLVMDTACFDRFVFHAQGDAAATA